MSEALSRLSIVAGTHVTICNFGSTNHHENSHNITHKTTTDSHNTSSCDRFSINNLSDLPDALSHTATCLDKQSPGGPLSATSTGNSASLAQPPASFQPSRQTFLNPFRSTNAPNASEPRPIFSDHDPPLKSNNPFRRQTQRQTQTQAFQAPLNPFHDSLRGNHPQPKIYTQHDWESFLDDSEIVGRGSIESSGPEHHRDEGTGPCHYACASEKLSQCMFDGMGSRFSKSHCRPCSGPFHTPHVVHCQHHDRDNASKPYPQAGHCSYSSSPPAFQTPPRVVHAPCRTCTTISITNV